MGNIYDKCKQIVDLINEMEEEARALATEQSRVEQEELDITHHIELHELTKVEGYNAYLDLKQCLEHRRDIKNELFFYKVLNDQGLKTFKNNMDKTMFFYNKKKLYTPRVREDLFPEITGCTPTEKPPVEETPSLTVTARKGKNIKQFSSVEEAVKFVANKNGKCANDIGWEELMQKRLIKAVNNKTEFCGYRWTITTN